MKVSVKCNTIKDIAKTIDTESLYNIDSYIKKFQDLTENMKSAWKGTDADNFQSQMTEFFDDLKHFQEFIRTFNDFMYNYARDLSRLDENYANKKVAIK